MKKLIYNNFIYYTHSLSKVLISLAFILSFFGILKIYDELELMVNYQTAIQSRYMAYRGYGFNLYSDYFEENADYLEEIGYFDQFSMDNLNEAKPLSPEILEVMYDTQKINEIESIIQSSLLEYATLQSSGRMDGPLTLRRIEINDYFLRVYDYLDDKEVYDNRIKDDYKLDIDYVRLEAKRLAKLERTNTADLFNEYSLTATNIPSRMIEGIALFIIFIFVLLLYYDLFSKDFDYRTYRIIYSEAYSRKEIILSKIIFAIIYTALLMMLGILLVFTYLLIVKRVGYGVVASRVGYILHPIIINVNPFVTFGFKPFFVILPMIVINLLWMIFAGVLIVLWINLISLFSFKMKSSSSVLTIGVFLLLTMFFINFTPLQGIFSLLFPIYGFTFSNFIVSASGMYILWIILVSVMYMLVILKVLFKNIESIDLLDGGSHD